MMRAYYIVFVTWTLLLPLVYVESTYLVLQEVKLEGGRVGCSSVYDTTSTYAPSNAILHAGNRFWQSGRDSEGLGELNVPFPHMIWYEFKTAFIPRQVSFRSANPNCSAVGNCGATKYQFIGSNDPVCNRYSKWTVLCEDMSGDYFRRISKSKYCTVMSERREKFRCLGVSVLDSSSYKGYATVSMAGLRMWK